MNNNDPQKFVGVGNIFIKEDKVLLVFQKNTKVNNNMYGLIGGLVEKGESARDAAIRESEEEIGIKIKKEDMKLVHCLSSIENEKETMGLYFLINKWEDEPINKEIIKHDHIKWFPLNNLPQNLIERNRQALEMMKANVNYSEWGWKE